jgi:hypothetical protein
LTGISSCDEEKECRSRGYETEAVDYHDWYFDNKNSGCVEERNWIGDAKVTAVGTLSICNKYNVTSLNRHEVEPEPTWDMTIWDNTTWDSTIWEMSIWYGITMADYLGWTTSDNPLGVIHSRFDPQWEEPVSHPYLTEFLLREQEVPVG